MLLLSIVDKGSREGSVVLSKIRSPSLYCCFRVNVTLQATGLATPFPSYARIVAGAGTQKQK